MLKSECKEKGGWITDVVKEREQRPMGKLQHTVFILKSFTDNKANSYMCLVVDIIYLKVSVACVSVRFKGGLTALPLFSNALLRRTLHRLPAFFSQSCREIALLIDPFACKQSISGLRLKVCMHWRFPTEDGIHYIVYSSLISIFVHSLCDLVTLLIASSAKSEVQ